MNTIWRPDLAQFPGPKYQALARALREAIRTGELAEGAQLPPVRDLAWALGITPGTVARAYGLVTQEGMLSGEVGRGTFVAARHRPVGPRQALMAEPRGAALVDMRTPQLPDLGQGAALAERLAAVARGPGAWLDYPGPRAEAPLRAAVVGWLGSCEMGPLSPDDLALVSGGQHGILTVLLCCLRGDRPVVAIEDLAYPGFRHAIRLARAEPMGLEMDDQGVIPAAFDAACRARDVQVLCLTPDGQNPTAARMGAERRAQIAALARRHDVMVIEDDCYDMGACDLPSLRALAPERVWHVASLSKAVSPALRFGFVVCPAGLGEAGRLTVQHACYGLARPVADLVLDLLTTGTATAIRRQVQDEVARRLQAILNRLGRFDLRWQPGLPFVWLRLPLGWRASTFLRVAEGEGILLRSADEYALAEGRAPNAVRLALAGAVSAPRFEAALDRLVQLLDNPPRDLSA